jgi:hypothetical protein
MSASALKSNDELHTQSFHFFFFFLRNIFLLGTLSLKLSSLMLKCLSSKDDEEEADIPL